MKTAKACLKKKISTDFHSTGSGQVEYGGAEFKAFDRAQASTRRGRISKRYVTEEQRRRRRNPAQRRGISFFKQALRPGGGFTLIELMMVISITALVVTLALSGAQKARGQVDAALCRENLRQWGQGTWLYAVDHRMSLPPEGFPNPNPGGAATGWYVQLPRHMGAPDYFRQEWRTNAGTSLAPSLWLCPANTRLSNGLNLFHYCLNQHIDGTGRFNRTVKLHELMDPHRLVWLFDSKNRPAVGSRSYLHTNLHRGGAQVLFIDGHVQRFSVERFREPETGRARLDPEIQWIPVQ